MRARPEGLAVVRNASRSIHSCKPPNVIARFQQRAHVLVQTHASVSVDRVAFVKLHSRGGQCQKDVTGTAGHLLQAVVCSFDVLGIER